MVVCEAFESLQSHTFSDICMTNKRKQNNGHRFLEVLNWNKGTSLSKTTPCQCPINLQPYYERLMF